MNQLFSLKDKVSVITGGGGLIGREIVRLFAEAGSEVICADIHHEKCDLSIPNVQHLQVDLANSSSVKKSIETLLSVHGRIDNWVNNAYPRTADWGKPGSEFSTESWQKNVEMQLNSYCQISLEIAEKMKNQNRQGSIVNLGSIYGVVSNDFTMYEDLQMYPSAQYAAIKGGVINFSRFLAGRYGPYGIRVNALCPGGVADNQNPIFVERYQKRVPLRRMAQASEVASCALFLCSPAASYVTGSCFMVDGGWTSL